MVSLEPWTINGCGYPDLLASGEICDGDAIHDRQHPHDLFMEIAAECDRSLAGAAEAAFAINTGLLKEDLRQIGPIQCNDLVM